MLQVWGLPPPPPDGTPACGCAWTGTPPAQPVSMAPWRVQHRPANQRQSTYMHHAALQHVTPVSTPWRHSQHCALTVHRNSVDGTVGGCTRSSMLADARRTVPSPKTPAMCPGCHSDCPLWSSTHADGLDIRVTQWSWTLGLPAVTRMSNSVAASATMRGWAICWSDTDLRGCGRCECGVALTLMAGPALSCFSAWSASRTSSAFVTPSSDPHAVVLLQSQTQNHLPAFGSALPVWDLLNPGERLASCLVVSSGFDAPSLRYLCGNEGRGQTDTVQR